MKQRDARRFSKLLHDTQQSLANAAVDMFARPLCKKRGYTFDGGTVFFYSKTGRRIETSEANNVTGLLCDVQDRMPFVELPDVELP